MTVQNQMFLRDREELGSFLEEVNNALGEVINHLHVSKDQFNVMMDDHKEAELHQEIDKGQILHWAIVIVLRDLDIIARVLAHKHKEEELRELRSRDTAERVRRWRNRWHYWDDEFYLAELKKFRQEWEMIRRNDKEKYENREEYRVLLDGLEEKHLRFLDD